MSHFNNQYGNYYDPVGSQPSRPSGYSYSASPSSAAYQNSRSSSAYGSGYGSNYQRTDGSAYNNQQQYRANNTQQSASSARHAAAALSSLSNQDYTQSSSGSRTTGNTQYDNGSWYPVNSNANYGNNMQVPNRSQSNNSPLYPTAQQSSSTFGRISIPEQTQSSSNTFGASQNYQNTNPNSATNNRSYQTAYTQQTQPQRYNSPLHAVQAQQHGHAKQSSRSSNHQPSPQMQTQSTNRQQSTSVEPQSMTVDPSQVYDNRAELQRKAQIEAERRRKIEAEQAAQRAEEERIAEQKRKEEEAKKAEEEAAAAAAKKAEQEKKNAQRKKAREDKKQSKSAATTLQQMAASMAQAGEGVDDEAQMRAMFQKMREFNAKNPALLAKLWDEERKSHEASKAASPPQPPAAPSSAAPTAASPTAPKAATKATPKAGPSAKAQAAALNAIGANKQSPAQPRQDKPTANASLWPPHKKSSLSEATAKWLNAMPENANVNVTPATVLNVLNDNPSYVELCRSLESLGLKFDRSQLARELLKAVPDGLKPQATVQPSTPVVGATATPQVNGSSASPGKPRGRPRKDRTDQAAARPGSAAGATVNYEAPISLSDAAREVNSMHRPSYQTPHGAPTQAVQSPQVTQPQSQTLTNGSRAPSQSQPPEIKEEVKPEGPPRPPADKEEAARKRTFGDLVDLTAEDSDDEAPPPKKMMQAPPAAANGGNNQSQFLQKPMSFDQFMHRPQGQSMSTSPYFPVPSNGPMPPPAPPGVQQPPARPTPPPPPKQKGPTPEQLQQARLRGKMLVEPIMRDRVARKSNYDSRTIARDVLLATGRHPDMRGLNAHLANMQKLLAQHGGEFDSGGSRSDLNTIKWDVIDPVPPKVEKKAKEAANPDSLDSESRAPPTKQKPALTEYETPKFGSPSISEDRLIKRPRGRPPRQSLPSTLTNGNAAAGPSNSNTPARQASNSRPSTPNSAPAPAMSSNPAVGYAAFQQLNPDGTKKKGRPFGWKKNVHSREAQGLPKISHPSQAVGAPSKLKASTSTSATPKEKAQKETVQPQYQEYKCLWDGCDASLMNLDTLKKHIVKLHGKANERGEYFCWWKDCKGVKKPGLAGRVPWKGEQIEEWIEHIDSKHIRPIAWKLGDGPRGGVAADTSLFYQDSPSPPAYLSDSRGRSVTPIISPPMPIRPLPAAQQLQPSQPSVEGDEDMTSPPQQPLVKPRGRPRKDGAPPGTVPSATKAEGKGGIERDPDLRNLAQHQRLVGPLMERMGCVLASDERRTTFLDDEDFEDEVWGSDHDVRN